ncbi:MAG: hypothetical protein K9L74_01275 [Candidatus Izimaplasma sp.]|nr:hypothetical protein [Candidatus Izimaplasma bacterium]
MITRRFVQISTVAILLIGFIFTSGSAFAYWREVNVSRDVEIVKIGEPIEIIVDDIYSESNLHLVPEGYIISVQDVEEVQLEYEVSVSRELINTVNLNIRAVDILIDGSDTYSHLVDISIMGLGSEAQLDLFNEALTIYVTVRLEEPFDEEEVVGKNLDESLVNVEDSELAYQTITGKTITFTLNFELEVKEISSNDNSQN